MLNPGILGPSRATLRYEPNKDVPRTLMIQLGFPLGLVFRSTSLATARTCRLATDVGRSNCSLICFPSSRCFSLVASDFRYQCSVLKEYRRNP